MIANKKISERADVLFMEMYSVSDIVKGDNVEMYREAWTRARYELEGGTSGYIDKVLLGTLLDITITEIYDVDNEYVELYTEGSKVKTMTLQDIISLYQEEISQKENIDIPVVGSDLEKFNDVILENVVIHRNIPNHSGRMIQVTFMSKDEYEQRRA